MILLQSLARAAGFHHVVRWCQVRELVQSLPNFRRIVPTLPLGAKLFAYWEDIFLEEEFSGREAYRKAIRAASPETFADLGCNAGWFAALLAHETGNRHLRGLMVDANPAMVEKAAWIVRAHKLNDVHVLHGLGGAGMDGPGGDFFLLPSNFGCSQFRASEPGKPPKGEWKRISVPRIDLEEAWVERFGNVRCHLLKVDTEGSEKLLFATDSKFLERIDRIVLEWHKWIISRRELDALLTSRGFQLVAVLEECETSGVAWYRAISGHSHSE